MYEPKIPKKCAIARTIGNSAKRCTTPIPAERTHRVYILVLLKVLHCLFSVDFIGTELAIFTFLLSKPQFGSTSRVSGCLGHVLA